MTPEQVHLTVEVPSPFRLDLTVWTLRRRVHNLIDRWDGEYYRRTLVSHGLPMEVSIRQPGSSPEPPGEPARLDVELCGKSTAFNQTSEAEIRLIIARTLGLEVELDDFYRLADNDPHLRDLARGFMGMRPPCFPTVFETVVNAIACQQLSLLVGIHLLNRLSHGYGSTVSDAPDAQPSFPTPERLAEADPTELRQMGFSRAKARAVIEMAQREAGGGIDLEGLRDADDQHAATVLLGLVGVGRWSTEYTLLRGLRRWHIFPGDDVGARHHLKKRFELAEPPGYDDIAALSRGWAPYSGLVYFHLLLDGLVASGHLPDAEGGVPTP